MVSKFVQPDFTSMDPATYKAAIDNAIAALGTSQISFYPYASNIPDQKVNITAGTLYKRASGQVLTVSDQYINTDSLSGNILCYLDEFGVAKATTNTSIPSAGYPLASIYKASAASVITDADIVDIRAWNTTIESPRNVYVYTTSSTFTPPNGAKFLRISAGGAGGGGGGGSSVVTPLYGGGGSGGSGGIIINRLWAAEALTIVIGAGGTGGAAATGAAIAGSNGGAGGTTTITGVTSTTVISIAGAAGGTGASAAAAGGSAGAAGAAPTNGLAGFVGNAGTSHATTAKGGDGPGCGNTGTASPRAFGGGLLLSKLYGDNGVRGSGGGGGVKAVYGSGGSGGSGWVMIEVF